MALPFLVRRLPQRSSSMPPSRWPVYSSSVPFFSVALSGLLYPLSRSKYPPPHYSSAHVDVPPSESTAHYYASPNHSFSSRNSTVSSRNTEISTPTESSSAMSSHTSCQFLFFLLRSSSPVVSFFLASRLFHFQAQCTFPFSEVLSGVLPEHYHWFAAALEQARPSVT